jgi:hypothetical protein
MYLSWALFAEGNSDLEYLTALAPRVLEDILQREGTRPVDVPNTGIILGSRGRKIEEVAAEACDAQNSFHLLFVHADTGGRALERGLNSRSSMYVAAMNARCGIRVDRSVIIAPRRETEAWILGDRDALLSALGFRDPRNELGLPLDAAVAERLPDPKAVLNAAVDTIYDRRQTAKRYFSFGPIALRRDLRALRSSDSFDQFYNDLRRALVTWDLLEN